MAFLSCNGVLELALALAHSEPRRAAVGIRHTQAPAVNVQETTNSLQSEALGPAATMGPHTSSVNRPSCNAESVAASRAYTPLSTATPATMKAQPVKIAHVKCQGSQPGTIETVLSR